MTNSEEGKRKWMIGLWREPSTDLAAFSEAVSEEWAPAIKAPGLGVVVDLPAYPAEEENGAPTVLVSLRPERGDNDLGDSEVEGLLAGACDQCAAVSRRQTWRVREHVRKGLTDKPPAGEEPGGIKMISFMRPVAGKTAAQCLRYWRDHHTGLALRIHIGLADYRQNEVLHAENVDDNVYGISELYFRSDEDFAERFFDSDAGREAIFADVALFLGLEESWTLITRPASV